MAIYSSSVLAGAYKGSDKIMLTHATSDEAITLGKMKRESGEAFCNKKLNLADSCVYEAVSEVTCPKCLEILARS